jgi:tetraacyldisaccharide 4'-kinase
MPSASATLGCSGLTGLPSASRRPSRGTVHLPVLSALYAAIVRRRREYYAARPHIRKRLRRPVISVGNLAVGGRGKTPVVAHIARLLIDAGERPAVLSRGYARRQADAGVVIVRDSRDIRADVDRAGDEPFMLARQLPGAVVLSSPDRYLAGCLAEHHFNATVHVLDDGFQHLQLDRDVNIVIVGREDVQQPVTLPFGRLREPMDTLIAADAILTAEPGIEIDTRGADIPVFTMRRAIADPPLPGIDRSRPIFVLAGIAGPERFIRDLRGAGWQVAGVQTFRDHHPYSARDLERVVAAARGRGAAAILTTEKDYVRLLRFRPFPMPTGWVPLTMEPDAPHEFRQWLTGSVGAARDLIP